LPAAAASAHPGQIRQVSWAEWIATWLLINYAWGAGAEENVISASKEDEVGKEEEGNSSLFLQTQLSFFRKLDVASRVDTEN
jgi:hypothetical protein